MEFPLAFLVRDSPSRNREIESNIPSFDRKMSMLAGWGRLLLPIKGKDLTNSEEGDEGEYWLTRRRKSTG
jgi:hypothetical protein